MARWRCGLQGCVEYKVRESAGSYIKFRNIQVRGISKYEVRGRKKRPQTTRFEIWPDGGVGYKVVWSTRLEKCPKKSRKKRIFGAEYKVVWSTRLDILKINES